MKKIKINFYNMWGGFFTDDNVITNTLKIKYDVETNVPNPDIVICQNTESVPANRVTSEFKGKSKIIHWHVEAFDRIGKPDHNKCDFSISSCTFENDRNLRIPLWSMYVDWFNNPYCEGRNQAFLVSPKKLTTPKEKECKKKFCSALTNNDLGYRGEAYPQFINFAVENGLFVESRGNFCRTAPKLVPHGDERDKLNWIKDFKFHLTYDNSDVHGWITEKLLHPMSESVIPIYWGGVNVEDEFNKNAFVHIRNFSNLEEAHEKILEIYKNEDLFHEIQTQPCFPDNKIPECATPEFFLPTLERFVEA